MEKCLELDVTDADACFDVFEKAEKLHGHIDVLVNNAGMSYLGAVEDFSLVRQGFREVHHTDAL